MSEPPAASARSPAATPLTRPAPPRSAAAARTAERAHDARGAWLGRARRARACLERLEQPEEPRGLAHAGEGDAERLHLQVQLLRAFVGSG
jgi:hypothetical protein